MPALIRGKWTANENGKEILLAGGEIPAGGNTLVVFIGFTGNVEKPKVSDDKDGETGWVGSETHALGNESKGGHWVFVKARAKGTEEKITSSVPGVGSNCTVQYAEIAGISGEIDNIQAFNNLGGAVAVKEFTAENVSTNEAGSVLLISESTCAASSNGALEAWTGGPPILKNPVATEGRGYYGYEVPGKVETKNFTGKHATGRKEVAVLAVSFKAETRYPAYIAPVVPPTFQTPRGLYKPFPPGATTTTVVEELFTGLLKPETAVSTKITGEKVALAPVKVPTAISQKVTAFKITTGAIAQTIALTTKVTAGKFIEKALSGITTAYTTTAKGIKQGVATIKVTTALQHRRHGLSGAIAQSNPAAWWRLNETSGTKAYDFYGGENGTYEEFGAAYKLNQHPEQAGHAESHPGVRFEGTQKASDKAAGVTLPSNAPVLRQTTEFTLEFMLYAKKLGPEQVQILDNANNSTGETGWQCGFDSAGHLRMDTESKGKTFAGRETNEVWIFPGEWNHYIYVYNGNLPEAERVKFYVNGELRTPTKNIFNGPPAAIEYDAGAGSPPRIGTTGDGFGTYSGLDGILSDVAFYKRAMPAAEVKEHFEKTYQENATEFKIVEAVSKVPTAITQKIVGLKETTGKALMQAAFTVKALAAEEFVGAISTLTALATKITGQKVTSGTVPQQVGFRGSVTAGKVANGVIRAFVAASTGLKASKTALGTSKVTFGLRTAQTGLKQAVATIRNIFAARQGLEGVTLKPLPPTIFATVAKPTAIYHDIATAYFPSRIAKTGMYHDIAKSEMPARVAKKTFGIEME